MMGRLVQVTAVVLASMFGYLQLWCYTLAPSECRSPGDCGAGECCVLGMMRYSMAQCMPLGKVEDYCREDGYPENRTLHYTGGESVEVKDIYLHVCPCEDGLFCDDNFCAPLNDSSYETSYLY